MPVTNDLINKKDDIRNLSNSDSNQKNNSNINKENIKNNTVSNPNYSTEKKQSFMNSYFIVGMICLLFFGYFFYKKKIKKN